MLKGKNKHTDAEGKKTGAVPEEEKKAGDEIKDEVQAEETAQEANAKAAAEAAAALEEEEARDAQEAADGGAASAEGAGGEKSQIDELEEEISKRDETIALMHDKLQRQMAEFENFRKRTEKEKQTMFSMGERSVIEKMLPIVDNFERGLAAVPENEKDTPLASGMEMVYRQLVKQLEDLGVTPIEAVGQEFDPNFHNAVMQVESEEYPSGTVAQEFQKGYKYHDAVIRYSMVGVVQ